MCTKGGSGSLPLVSSGCYYLSLYLSILWLGPHLFLATSHQNISFLSKLIDEISAKAFRWQSGPFEPGGMPYNTPLQLFAAIAAGALFSVFRNSN
jgi:hypothetical protein